MFAGRDLVGGEACAAPCALSLPMARALAVSDVSDGDAGAGVEAARRHRACAAADASAGGGFARPTARLEAFLDAEGVVPHDARLGLLLLHAARSGGEYWRYYARHVVPPLEAAPPLLAWSEAELAMLGDARLANEGRELRERADRIADEWRQAFTQRTLGSAPPTDAEARWALAACSSRCFSTERPEEDWPAMVLLCPLLDLANHDVAPNAMWEYDAAAEGGEGAMRLVSCRPADPAEPEGVWLAQGDEVLISYSPSSDNRHLLTHYGFAVDANANDRLSAEDITRAGLAALSAEAVLACAGVSRDDLDWIIGDCGVRPPLDRRRLCAVASLREAGRAALPAARHVWLEQAQAAAEAARQLRLMAGELGTELEGVPAEALDARVSAAAAFREQRALLLGAAAGECDTFVKHCVREAEAMVE